MNPTIARVATATALTCIAFAGTVTSASANDDSRRATGDCTRSSEYIYRLSDSGTELRNQSLRLFINGQRGKGREWTLTIYVDGDKEKRLEKKTDSKGNVEFSHTFAADDDADVRVLAEAGYGETCQRTLSLG